MQSPTKPSIPRCYSPNSSFIASSSPSHSDFDIWKLVLAAFSRYCRSLGCAKLATEWKYLRSF